MINRFERIKHLYRAITKGVDAETAYSELDERERRAHVRERLSVDAVVAALSKLPEVASLRETQPFSKDDKKFRDLVVKLRFVKKSEETVWVQVKSSITGIRSFMERYAERYNLDFDPFTIQLHMSQKKMIILNGNTSEQQIQESFLAQLEMIKHEAEADVIQLLRIAFARTK